MGFAVKNRCSLSVVRKDRTVHSFVCHNGQLTTNCKLPFPGLRHGLISHPLAGTPDFQGGSAGPFHFSRILTFHGFSRFTSDVSRLSGFSKPCFRGRPIDGLVLLHIYCR